MNLFRSPFAFLEIVFVQHVHDARRYVKNIRRVFYIMFKNTQQRNCKFALYLQLPLTSDLCIPFDNILFQALSCNVFLILLFLQINSYLKIYTIDFVINMKYQILEIPMLILSYILEDELLSY